MMMIKININHINACTIIENKTLAAVRKLYFELKEQVFANARLGYGCDTDALETLLQREFGTDEKMLPLPDGPKLVNTLYTKINRQCMSAKSL